MMWEDYCLFWRSRGWRRKTRQSAHAWGLFVCVCQLFTSRWIYAWRGKEGARKKAPEMWFLSEKFRETVGWLPPFSDALKRLSVVQVEGVSLLFLQLDFCRPSGARVSSGVIDMWSARSASSHKQKNATFNGKKHEEKVSTQRRQQEVTLTCDAIVWT